MAPRRTAQMAITALLLLGCAFVLSPFVAAILFAGTVCITTWPLYEALHRRLGRRDGLAAITMTLLLTALLLVPMIGLAASLTDAVISLVDYVRTLIEQSDGRPPAWVKQIPLVGQDMDAYIRKLTHSQVEMRKLALQAIEPARKSALTLGGLVGQGLLQITLVLFIGFFLYRDGSRIQAVLEAGAERLGSQIWGDLLELAANTVKAVMIGIVGTAAAQALVALIGFVVAGVPGALLLAAGVFFLSLVPVGPPLIWGGAAFWLYQQGESGWAVFMVLWGTFAVSSVDNFLKPFLISRTASLPILLIALGAFGGVLAFGFIGIFLGPTFLALGQALFVSWTLRRPKPANAIEEAPEGRS
ncbi:AI-2E family transporter [Zoogloea sp.]|uniref:AI-2E family transporter n=1 Tax=Zoogloea sp. TaxID=49181 RepID=UPI00260E6D1F|nr:AI-2E family transporter [Zoogloea sp.]MDD3352979.1 AI-2E family transporter [Zoogloea sp.]